MYHPDDDEHDDDEHEDDDDEDQIYGNGYKEEWQLQDSADEDDDDDENEQEQEHDAQLPPTLPLHEQQYNDNDNSVVNDDNASLMTSSNKLLPRSLRASEMNLAPWTRKEKLDFEASLEHLVMAGNHARHLAWRKGTWERQERKQQQQQQQQQQQKALQQQQQQQQQQNQGHQNQGQQQQQLGQAKNDDDDDDDDDENDDEEKYNDEEKYEEEDDDDDDDEKGPSTIAAASIPPESTDTAKTTTNAAATATNNNNNDKNDNNILTRLPTWFERMVHAEDVRLYGERGYPDVPWPIPFTRHHQKILHGKMWIPMSYRRKAKRETPQLDVAWDEEHGDGIHPLLFNQTRCSKRIKREQDVSSLLPHGDKQKNYSEYNPDLVKAATTKTATTTTTTTNSEKQSLSYQNQTPTVQVPHVPRAMILRCWERAVHAASCTMACPVSNETLSPTAERATTTSAAKAAENVNPLFAEQQQQEQQQPQQQQQQQKHTFSTNNNTTNSNFSAIMAAVKCGNLEIPIPPRDAPPPLICPSCHVSFGDDPNHLDQHLFGTKNMGGGCIWQLIHRRQEELIRNVLQEQFTSQTAALLRLLFTQAQKDVALKRAEQQQQQDRAKTKEDDENDSANTNSDTPAAPSVLLDTPLPNKTWQDVLRYLRSALDESTACIPNTDYVLPQPADYLAMTSATATAPVMPLPPSLLETLQTELDSLPLILNHELLTVVSERLIDRYANVPN